MSTTSEGAPSTTSPTKDGKKALDPITRSVVGVMEIGLLESMAPTVTNPLQDFLSAALDGIKVYRPEITRLDGRNDDIAEALEKLTQTVAVLSESVIETREKTDARLADIDERLASVEAVINALPTWKDDITERIETVSKDTKLKQEQLSMKTQVLEENFMTNMQTTRDRLDTLTSLAKIASDSRTAHSDRMEGIELNVRQLETDITIRLNSVDHINNRHEDRLTTNDRKLTETSVLVGMGRLDIEAARTVAKDHDDQLNELKGGQLTLTDKQDSFDNSLLLVRKNLQALDVAKDNMQTRITGIEEDPRIPTLMMAANEFRAHREDSREYEVSNNSRLDDYFDKFQKLDAKVDRGPPGLWKVTAQVAVHGDEIKSLQTSTTATSRNLEDTKRSLGEAHSTLITHSKTQSDMQKDEHEMSSKMVTDFQRLMSLIETRTENLAAKYEVEAVRKTLSDVKRELQEGISSMSLRVKFDLLHDEAPQVATLKEYMEQTEEALLRTKEKLGWMEEAMYKEIERGVSLEKTWVTTRKGLDNLILTGDLDVNKLRRDMEGFRTMFEELAKLSIRGDIITSTQAETMVDDKLRGTALDGVLARKLNESGPLSTALASLAPRHEVEALRKMLVDSRQEIIALQHSRGAGPESSQYKDFDSMSRSDFLLQHNASNVSTATGVGALLPFPQQSLASDAPLLTIYARIAAAEEAIMQNQEQTKAVQTQIQVTDQRLVMLKADSKPAVAGDPLAHTLMGELGAGKMDGSSLAAEEALRRAVNRSLLPEVHDRLAADTKRVLKYVDEQVDGAAKVADVEALRKTLKRVRHELADVISTAASTQASLVQLAAKAAAAEEAARQLPSDAAAESSEASGGAEGVAGSSGGARAASPTKGVQDHASDTATAAESALTSAWVKKVSDLEEKLDQLAEQVKTHPVPREHSAATDDHHKNASVLASRIALLEGSVDRLKASHMPASATFAASALTAPDSEAVEDMIDSKLSGLHATLAGLSVQLPMLAKAYEVESLRKKISAVHADLVAAIQDAGTMVQLAMVEAPPKPPTPPEILDRLSGGTQTDATPTADASSEASPAADNSSAEGADADAGADADGEGGAPPPEGADGEPAPAAPVELVDDGVQRDPAPMFVIEPRKEVPPPPPLPPYTSLVNNDVLAVLNEGLMKTQSQHKANVVKMGEMESVMTMCDERSRALEGQWTAVESRILMALAQMKEDLPRFKAEVRSIQDEVASLSGAGVGKSGSQNLAPTAEPSASETNSVSRPGSGRALNQKSRQTSGRPVSGRANGLSPLMSGALCVGLSSSQVSVGGDVEPPRAFRKAEHTDAELAGLMHDVTHAAHEELKALKEGPLPGSNVGLAMRGIRDAALKRLRAKPGEVQKHVGLLEDAKTSLSRLLETTAESSVDYVIIFCIMLDIRLKLLEDQGDLFKDQFATSFKNHEAVFEYLKKIRDSVNTKGSAQSVNQLERAVRAMSKECVDQGTKGGVFAHCRLGTWDFWSNLLAYEGTNSPQRGVSPLRTNHSTTLTPQPSSPPDSASPVRGGPTEPSRTSTPNFSTSAATRGGPTDQGRSVSTGFNVGFPGHDGSTEQGRTSSTTFSTSGGGAGAGGSGSSHRTPLAGDDSAAAAFTSSYPGAASSTNSYGSPSIGRATSPTRQGTSQHPTLPRVALPGSSAHAAPPNPLSPAFSGSMYPPPQFMTERRNIAQEQERMIATREGGNRPTTSGGVPGAKPGNAKLALPQLSGSGVSGGGSRMGSR